MNTATSRQDTHTLVTIIPLLADIAALIALFLWRPSLTAQLSAPSGINALLLSTLYILMLIGLWLIRKLAPTSVDGPAKPPALFDLKWVRAVLAVLAAMLMMTALAYQLGYFEVLESVGIGFFEEGSSSAFFVYAPSAWFGFAMFYVLVLAFNVTPTVSPDQPRYEIQAIIGLLLINSLLVFTISQLGAIFTTANMGAFLLALVLLLLAFLPPRLVYQTKHPQWPGLISAGLLLLFGAFIIAFA